ncbi:error-prone DNA polymerase [Cognatiluteimonas telluris]|uniref:error-prone DNA polymerase n=1 Tax=Cognatiluteimonas telluris TaxID=1104775 RepID=UPI001FAFF859|nr:error-prone DNA polymerase [Lysobacter telluris]
MSWLVHPSPRPLSRGERGFYAELHCLSDFSFGRGASNAAELFERARQQGYRALAITDECSLAGIVRGLEASRATGLRMIVGSEVTLDGDSDAPLKLVLLVETRAGYSTLCRLITQGRRRSEKGEYRLTRNDLDDGLPGLLVLWVPDARLSRAEGAWLKQRFDGRLWLAVELHRGPDDARRLQALEALAAELGIPAVASGDVHMHVRGRRRLQDTMTAIRHRTPIAQAGKRLFPNGERHLRTQRALSAIHPRHLLDETLRIAERCVFSLETPLGYEYPHELVPNGHTPQTWLRELVERGMCERWPEGASPQARALIEKELALIHRKHYEPYFLTVHDIVRHARSLDILCQGRGSAANSVVCYVLGVTSIDPARMGLLFERFLSDERNEPPDIDIDFEHERREEIIQYIYARYGRDRAAIAATVIRYRTRSAVRDVGRALGLPEDQLAQLSRSTSAWSSDTPSTQRLREYGFDPDSAVIRRLVELVGQLLGKPRHLSQHVGGFVISEHPLHTLVPVENAAMDERTIIQWDKDDLDTMQLLKVDVLALGMLTCVRKALELVRKHRGRDYTMATIPPEDAATYAMIQRGEVIGVFQIESRAQMAMLPRLKPETFYDLVIEVAIVRPGPIQGGMIHPYLRRRQGLEPVDYPSEALRNVLARTLGVPLFQEQVMRIAMEAAGYTPGQADQLRRDMAAWKRHGGLEKHRDALLEGMAGNGYAPDFAERIFEQIKGFGDYGFPESHAASFALITYVSSWIKCHEQAAFSCALLNSLPMGFYQPPQLVADARKQGIEVRPVDVRYSHWDCTLEEGLPAASAVAPLPLAGGGRDEGASPLALRLGMRLVGGLREAVAQRISAARASGDFRDLDDLVARADLDRGSLDRLAEAGALRGLAGHRHRARWQSAATEKQLPLFAAAQAVDARSRSEPRIAIPPPSAFEDTRADYASIGLTLGTHPVGLIRRALQQRRYRSARELAQWPDKRRARYAGLVILRQRPQTASGVTFMTLEDETGMVNVVVWAQVAERQRRVFLESQLLAVEGRMESAEGSQHLIATRLQDLSSLLGGVATVSRDFR